MVQPLGPADSDEWPALLLFTASYPYEVAAEGTFLPQELRVLCRYFPRLFLIPVNVGGGREVVSSDSVTVVTEYAEYVSSRARRLGEVVRCIADLPLLREIALHIAILLRRPGALRRIVAYHLRARLTERWLREFARERRLRPGTGVICTWWFDATTLGAGLFGASCGVPVVSRAHGHDVYEQRHDPPIIPFRRSALALVHAVYADSAAGAHHIASRYPAFAGRIRVGRLGVEDPGFVASPSSNGAVRIVSCSFLMPVKRLDLLIKATALLARSWPERQVRWTHIGGGPERSSLIALAESTFPANVKYAIRPFHSHHELFEFYRLQPIDLFVNLSSSEGTPVSLMEAISAGIPVLASAAGGNVEIVGPENGVLVPVDSDPEGVAAAMRNLLTETARLQVLRHGSRIRWRTLYHADTNYSAFARELLALVPGQ